MFCVLPLGGWAPAGCGARNYRRHLNAHLFPINEMSSGRLDPVIM